MPDLQSDPAQVVMRPFQHQHSAALDHEIGASAPKFSALNEDGAPPAPPARSSQSSGKLVDASIISKGRPVYPPAAKTMGISGKVEVRVVISESGKVVDATPISGHPMLRGAAVAAARQWVYKPATLNGLPVRTESTLTIAFGDQ
jgi:TonB family protein